MSYSTREGSQTIVNIDGLLVEDICDLVAKQKLTCLTCLFITAVVERGELHGKRFLQRLCPSDEIPHRQHEVCLQSHSFSSPQ